MKSSIRSVHMMLATCLVCCLTALAVPGCKTLTDPNNYAVQQITVQYATGKFIEGTTNTAKRAEDVRAVALQIKAVAASDSATIGALQEFAMAKVAAAHLAPADQLLANSLVAVIVQEL